jgi:hypothetical protein
MNGVTNLIEIGTNSKLKMSPDGDFFRTWVDFLKPVHKLTDGEMNVLAEYLKYRYELSKSITDPEIVDNILMSGDTRKVIRTRCGIKTKHLNVIINKFRKNGVLLKNGKIYPKLIPSHSKEGAGLMIYFNFRNEKQLVKLGPAASVKKA